MRTNHFLRFIVPLSLSVGCVTSASAQTQVDCDAKQSEFQTYKARNAGLWVSQNSYFSPEMEYRIRSYSSILDVQHNGDYIYEREIKYYPAGPMAQSASKGRAAKDEGVEMITERTFKMSEGCGLYAQTEVSPVYGDNISATYKILDEKTSVTRTFESGNDVESYSLYTYLPAPNKRYMVNFGVLNAGITTEIGNLRGFSTFFMSKSEAHSVDQLQQKMREEYKVRVSVVAGPDNKQSIIDLN